MEDSRRTLPVVQRQRTVTGGHRAVVIPRESGELDDETRQFLETLRGLEPAERATQLRAWMAQRGASQAAIQAAVTQVLNGGIDALRTHLTNTRDIRLREIDNQGQTDRARIAADRDIELEEIRRRAGLSNPDPGASNPNEGGGQSNPTTTETPGLSTGAKVAIGVGAGAAVLTVGYLLWQAMENRRREEEEKRRREEEFRLRMLQAGAR